MGSGLDACVTSEEERWGWSNAAYDVAMPPRSSTVNRQLLAALGRAETRRLQMLALAIRQYSPEVHKRYFLAEFLGALNDCTALERGRLLRTYALTNAHRELERCLNGHRVGDTESAGWHALRAYPNAYTILQIAKGREATELPLVFDEAASARFPGHRYYLQGGFCERNAQAAVRVENGSLEVKRMDGRVTRLPASSLVPRASVGAEGPGVIGEPGDLRVEERPCIPGCPIEIDNAEPLLRETLTRNNDEMNDAYVRGGLARPTAQILHVDPWDPDVRAFLAETVGAIREVWPEAYDDLIDFTQVIIPFDMVGAGLEGSSTERLAGVTIHRVSPQSIALKASNLLHENAHKRFFAIKRLFNALRNDGTERLPSPWRMDPRPLRGILLGVHAFTIVAQFYYRAIHSGVSWAESLEPKLHAEVRRLCEGLETIREHADVTPFGQRLVQGLADSVQSLRRAGFGR